jgi:ferric-dicitrate binding protein FerR (iron transport regulator)
MRPDKLEVADLLADETFINFCKRSSPGDIAVWEKFASENADNQVLVEQAKEVFIVLFNVLGVADRNEQVARLKHRLELMEASEPAPVVQMDGPEANGPGRKVSWLLKISAAAVVLIAAAFFIVRSLSSNSDKASKMFLAAVGERKNIQLPDGSDVTLNAGSRIEILGDFGKSTRDVFLEGEAFFDVKHNAKLPFVVHTAAMDVKALGTAFNVKAYLDERSTETSLIRGLVEITLKENNNRTMLLYPNQKIRWEHPVSKKAAGSPGPSNNNNNADEPVSLVKSLVVTDEGSIREVAWKDNKLVFDNELFADVALLLERWYGAEIEFSDDAIRYYRFTGSFEKEDIHTVLDFLKESKAFNYRIEQGEQLKVYLSK